MSKTEHRPTESAEALQDLLLESPDFEDFLSQLVKHSAAALGGFEGGAISISITVERLRQRTTIATSGAEASRMDELQYEAGDGPCLHALRTGETVLVPDLRDDLRWPGYLSAVGDFGFGSILAVPIRLEGEAGTALNCYAVDRHAYSAAAVTAAEGYAAIAAKALILAARTDSHARRTADLQAALESRTTIDLAVGIIMGQNNCSQEEAVDILRRASNTRNVKLRDIAAGVVQSVSGRATTHFDG